MQKIYSLEMTEKILLPALDCVVKYKELDGYQKICDDVEELVVSTTKDLSSNKRFRFYQENREDYPHLVQLLMNKVEKFEENDGNEPHPKIHCSGDGSKILKYYKENQGDPAVLKLLDNIMNDFVLVGREGDEEEEDEEEEDI